MSSGRVPHEPVAVLLDQALRVARERGRVARDIDDARRRELAEPLQRLAGEARPRRVDDDDVGLAGALSRSSRSTWPTFPAKKAALPIALSSAFSIAQATDSSEISIPQTVSASPASASPIVPIPQ